MGRVRYLADTSVFARLAKPPVHAVFAPLAAEGGIGICPPVAFELGYSARNRSDYETVTGLLLAFTRIPATDGDHRRAGEVQAALALGGMHRSLSLVDALVAAIAEARGLTILHYDSDFEVVAGITGQAHTWIVDRGTVD